MNFYYPIEMKIKRNLLIIFSNARIKENKNEN